MKIEPSARIWLAFVLAIAVASFVMPFVFIDCGRFGWLAWPWC